MQHVYACYARCVKQLLVCRRLRTVLVQGSNQAAPSLLPCSRTAIVMELAGSSGSSPSSSAGSACCLDELSSIAGCVIVQQAHQRTL
jgi:hypothetical protein